MDDGLGLGTTLVEELPAMARGVGEVVHELDMDGRVIREGVLMPVVENDVNVDSAQGGASLIRCQRCRSCVIAIEPQRPPML